MDPIDERISGGGDDRRARRAWGGLTVAVAGFAAAAAFLNGAFVGTADSAELEGAWVRELAGAPRQAVTVPGDFPTLQKAIEGVADGTTILLAPGTYAERIDLRGRSLHVWGVGGASHTRVIGDGTPGPVACVRGGSVRFDGIAFQGGHGETGRGLMVQQGSARLEACRFQANAGGGLGAQGAEVSLVDCELDGNRAALSGGAVLGEDAEVRLDRCTLRDNVAMTFGGAISLRGGTLRMIDTTVERNRVSSGAWGGGLYAEGADIVVERGTFHENLSAMSGAGAYVLGGSADLRDVRFGGNRCESGRSVHGEQTDLRVVGGTDDPVEALATAMPTGERAIPRRAIPTGRGTLDDCTATRGTLLSDCNDDGLDDACQIRNGLALDTDGDGRIDSCQAREAEATALAAAEPDAP